MHHLPTVNPSVVNTDLTDNEFQETTEYIEWKNKSLLIDKPRRKLSQIKQEIITKKSQIVTKYIKNQF